MTKPAIQASSVTEYDVLGRRSKEDDMMFSPASSPLKWENMMVDESKRTRSVSVSSSMSTESLRHLEMPKPFKL
jgi:hypothetical protein